MHTRSPPDRSQTPAVDSNEIHFWGLPSLRAARKESDSVPAGMPLSVAEMSYSFLPTWVAVGLETKPRGTKGEREAGFLLLVWSGW